MRTRLAIAALGLYVVAVWGFVGFAVYRWLEAPAVAQIEAASPVTDTATGTASTCETRCTAFPEARPHAQAADMISRNDPVRRADLPL